MDTFKKIIKGLFSGFTNINKDNWVYKLASFIGLLLRVILLPILFPNVFEVIANIFINKFNFQPWLYEIILRLILLLIDSFSLSTIFYWLSYLTVGNNYDSGTIPAWGSVCYTLYYFVYMAIPVILLKFFYWWVIIVTFIIYALLCLVIYIISAKIETLPGNWIFRLVLHCVTFVVVFTVICLLKIYLF